MKPEIEQKLVEYLTALESLMKDGKDLAIEQAPEVAKEIVSYGFASSAFFAVLFTGLFCVVAVVSIKVSLMIYKKEEDPFVFFLAVIALGLGSLFFGVPANINAQDAAKAYFAPRLYVIDYLRSEVKK